jgi:hypothetical protein
MICGVKTPIICKTQEQLCSEDILANLCECYSRRIGQFPILFKSIERTMEIVRFIYQSVHNQTQLYYTRSTEHLFMSFNRNTTGATGGAGTAHPSGSPEFTPVFQLGSNCSIFSFLCSILYIIVCSFSFGHCNVCPSLLCGFWLPLWYLLTFFVLLFAHIWNYPYIQFW